MATLHDNCCSAASLHCNPSLILTESNTQQQAPCCTHIRSIAAGWEPRRSLGRSIIDQTLTNAQCIGTTTHTYLLLPHHCHRRLLSTARPWMSRPRGQTEMCQVMPFAKWYPVRTDGPTARRLRLHIAAAFPLADEILRVAGRFRTLGRFVRQLSFRSSADKSTTKISVD